jgi:Ca2+-binding EF-hand superfamily protein
MVAWQMKALILGLSIGMKADVSAEALDVMFKDFDIDRDGEVRPPAIAMKRSEP